MGRTPMVGRRVLRGSVGSGRLRYNVTMRVLCSKKYLAVLMAFLLAFSVTLGGLATPASSFAEEQSVADTSENPALVAAQKKVTQSAEVYDEANDKVKELEKKAKKAQGKVDEIEKAIPEQQEKADAAMISLYKFSTETSGLLDLILNADSFGDFIDTMEYLNTVQTYNLSEIAKLNEMKTELVSARDQVESDLKEATEQREKASAALEEAKALRKQLQEKALKEAEEEAAAKKAEAEKKAAEKKKNESSGNKSDKNDSEESDAPALKDGEVNWDVSKDEFVATWTKRIDAYLAGSNLAGTGKYFAVAAWNYGVDPRWSPAISCVESGKGANCFLPYNAWGWGSSSWSSWKEAINAHVHGLAVGYGYTVTWANAQKYCPPNYKHWYNTCVSEMNKI